MFKTICSDLPRLLHHPWSLCAVVRCFCQKVFPVWVWAPAFGCAGKKAFSWFMMKLQFLACALATCLVAADISQLQLRGTASSGADVGAVEKEVANQTPQPAVAAPSPTEKENRAVPAPSTPEVVEKENPATSGNEESQSTGKESVDKSKDYTLRGVVLPEKLSLQNTAGSLSDTSSIATGATAAAVASEKLKSKAQYLVKLDCDFCCSAHCK